MANRAYLFCSDCAPNDPRTWTELDTNSQRYYDSRHNIPLSWFFFFRPDDVKLVDVLFAHGHPRGMDYEPKLVASKQQAFETFRQNESRLERIVGTDLYSRISADFLPSLQRMSGDSLCMDLGDLAEDNAEDSLLMTQIAELIGSEDTPVRAVREALSRFSTLTYKDENDARLNVIGCTYW